MRCCLELLSARTPSLEVGASGRVADLHSVEGVEISTESPRTTATGMQARAEYTYGADTAYIREGPIRRIYGVLYVYTAYYTY